MQHIETPDEALSPANSGESAAHFELKEGRKFIFDLDCGSYPFALPNGTPVAYSFPGDKDVKIKAGSRFFNWKPFANKWRDFQAYYPRLHFWKLNWQRQFIVCADFDGLTQEEYEKVREWGVAATPWRGHTHQVFRLGCKKLAEEYQEKIGHHGFVYNSPKSGRPKILLLIEYPEPVKSPATKDVVGLFEKLFPEHMASGFIDIARGAMSTTFFNWGEKERFSDALSQLVPIRVETNTKQTTFKTTTGDHTVESSYKYYKCETLPAELEFEDSSDKFKEFLKVLCTMSGLARSGFGISQLVLARTLEIDQPTCSRFIRKAIDMGLLEVVCDQYIPGQRAKIYKAKGALLAHLLSCVERVEPVKIPKKVREGSWHSTLLRLATTVFRASLGRFLVWVKTLPGWDVGDRFYQAQSIVQWLIRKHPELAAGL